MATNITGTKNLRLLVQETCRIYYNKLISQPAGHPSEEAYYALYQSIQHDITTNHPNSDPFRVNQFIVKYFNRLKRLHKLTMPIPDLYIRLKRGRNTIESENTMARLYESYQMRDRLQTAWQENLHQISLAQAFAALYASLWIYAGVQDEQIWQQVYHRIIDQQPLLRLGNALVITIDIPKDNYGYYRTSIMPMEVDATENAYTRLFVTRHIIADDVSLMWMAYIKRHRQGRVPTFEQTKHALEQIMQTCLQITKPKPNHINAMEKGLYYDRQTFKNSQLDMQMSAIVSDWQKHSSISSENWKKYHSPSFRPLSVALSDDLFTNVSLVKKGDTEPTAKPAVYKFDLVREISNILKQSTTTAIASLEALASQTQISAQLGLIYCE